MSNRKPDFDENYWLAVGIVLVSLINIALSILGLYLVDFIGNKFFGGSGNYAILIGFTGVWLYQLLYVIPLILSLKRRRKFALMKGVIIGAVITALVAGLCFVGFFSYVILGK